jgi:hypothetical protein
MGLLDKLFGGTKKSKNVDRSTKSDDKAKDILSFDFFLKKHIDDSIYIDDSSKGKLFDALSDSIDYFNGGENLTLDEKKEYEFNTRAKIPREILEFLSETGFKLKNPLSAISQIKNKSEGDYSRYRSIVTSQQSGLSTSFQILSTEDDRTCNWCKEINKQYFPIDTDINEMIRKNCTCEDWCRIVLNFES